MDCTMVIIILLHSFGKIFYVLCFRVLRFVFIFLFLFVFSFDQAFVFANSPFLPNIRVNISDQNV